MKKRFVIFGVLLLAAVCAAAGYYYHKSSTKKQVFAQLSKPLNDGLEIPPEQLVIPKTTYSVEEIATGMDLYSDYFGVINVRKGPSTNDPVIGVIGYGMAVHTTVQETGGFTQVTYTVPNTGEVLTGYAVSDSFTKTKPADSRIYLPIYNFKQYDEAWADTTLGDSYETIKTAGCTTTCLAMSYSYFEGKRQTPEDMVPRLFYNDDGELGMPKVYVNYDGEHFRERILTKLKEGVPVLVGGRRVNNNPHWVLVVGYDGDGTESHLHNFYIHDPNSTERITLEDFFRVFIRFNRLAYYAPEEIPPETEPAQAETTEEVLTETETASEELSDVETEAESETETQEGE